MKKNLFLFILFLFVNSIFANPNYNNGNGTIIEYTEENGLCKTVRKCEIENVIIGDLLKEENRDIYESYNYDKRIGKLKNYDNVKILEVCIYDAKVWYKIKLDETIGCICINANSNNPYINPYYHDRYEVLEEIYTSKKWTVRKLEEYISVWEKLNVRDKPGLDGKKIFLLHDFPEGSRNPQENYKMLAITEEKDSIDGFSDYWLKIEYEEGKYGWIFGGYATVERGGPKYYIPENIVLFTLSWY